MQFGKIFVASMKSRSDRRDALALGMLKPLLAPGNRTDMRLEAAAGTGIDLTFVDGVRREDIPDKALPPLKGLAKDGFLTPGTFGAWRTHANILRESVDLSFFAII